MSLFFTIGSACIGVQGFDALTRQIAAAAIAAGGTALSVQCLAKLVKDNSDEGQTAKTFTIKAAAETAGGTSLNTSCLYTLVKNNWQ
tara:strand:- start:36397 stop:36657 length:261 start_codon:yes stop_codon:yes gene_type:complete